VFDVPLDTLYAISGTIYGSDVPTVQSTEGQWFVNCVKDQSHEAQLTQKGKEKDVRAAVKQMPENIFLRI